MYEVNRSVVTVIPQVPFWNWITTLPDTDLEFLSLEDLQENANAYLINPCDDLDEAWEEVISSLDVLFSAELADWCENEDYWPDLHPDIFVEWFDLQLAPIVTDLSHKEINRIDYNDILEDTES